MSGVQKTRLALFDDKFRTIEDVKFKTPKTTRQFATALTNSVRRLMKSGAAKNPVISAVGIGFAGAVNGRKGAITFDPNIPVLVGFSFKKTRHHLCHCKVVLLNDVHAALLWGAENRQSCRL
jgi:predicted NBD/HSP70 family sugar kinase